MPCPTCDHTLSQIHDCGIFWCPRCGTLLLFPEDILPDVPMLVKRCRTFALECGDRKAAWHRIGIDESINLPQDRQGA